MRTRSHRHLQMHTPESIRRVDQIFVGRSIELPERPGVYVFWWVGPRADLMAANRHIVLKGPGERPVDVEYREWWPEELVYPCLYVGKTTNVRKRFSLHIKRDCPGRLHQAHPENVKAKPCTTSCQLYRNCPGRKNPAQSCLVCRGSPDRDLTFITTFEVLTPTETC